MRRIFLIAIQSSIFMASGMNSIPPNSNVATKAHRVIEVIFKTLGTETGNTQTDQLITTLNRENIPPHYLVAVPYSSNNMFPLSNQHEEEHRITYLTKELSGATTTSNMLNVNHANGFPLVVTTPTQETISFSTEYNANTNTGIYNLLALLARTKPDALAVLISQESPQICRPLNAKNDWDDFIKAITKQLAEKNNNAKIFEQLLAIVRKINTAPDDGNFKRITTGIDTTNKFDLTHHGFKIMYIGSGVACLGLLCTIESPLLNAIDPNSRIPGPLIVTGLGTFVAGKLLATIGLSQSILNS